MQPIVFVKLNPVVASGGARQGDGTDGDPFGITAYVLGIKHRRTLDDQVVPIDRSMEIIGKCRRHGGIGRAIVNASIAGKGDGQGTLENHAIVTGDATHTAAGDAVVGSQGESGRGHH